MVCDLNLLLTVLTQSIASVKLISTVLQHSTLVVFPLDKLRSIVHTMEYLQVKESDEFVKFQARLVIEQIHEELTT